MAHFLVHHKVEDYKTWKSVFDGHSFLRSEAGSLGGKIFRSTNDPNEVFTLLEWDSLANAQKFAQSSIKEAMKKSRRCWYASDLFFRRSCRNI